ncbi:MAG: hypothetical protein R3F19_25055 [Verrucomicrobiales bacterium]
MDHDHRVDPDSAHRWHCHEVHPVPAGAQVAGAILKDADSPVVVVIGTGEADRSSSLPQNRP